MPSESNILQDNSLIDFPITSKNIIWRVHLKQFSFAEVKPMSNDLMHAMH